ncbi:MAG: glycosyltransferase family 39 protein [Acidobacteria bacterium]|nr:glycosyltransferase family 39 protein [Acidobacteriota bacterium]
MGNRRITVYALVAMLLAAGTVLRVVNLGAPAFCCDEFFDVFAARSWLAGDGYRVPGREYTRALLMTRLTAGSFALFGESEWSARLPSVLFGLATLPLVYVAGRWWFGRVAGLVALGLTALSVHAIDVSRFARLYSLLTLLLLGCALAVYRGLEGRGGDGPRLSPARFGWFAAAGILGLVAFTLHPVGVSIGVAIQVYVSTLTVVMAVRGDAARARVYGFFAAAILLVEVVVFSIPELRNRLLQAALQPLPWYSYRPGDEWVHFRHLSATYGWVWYLVMPATILLVAARLKAGLFLGLLFWLPLCVVSFVVATKHPRYSVQFLPFAWLILGGAAQVVAEGLERRQEWPLLRRRPLPAAVTLLAVVAGLGAVLWLTPAFRQAARRPLEATGTFTTGFFYDWRGTAGEIRGALPPDVVVVSDMWHESIYYLDREAYQLLAAHRQAGAGDWETPDRDYSEKIQGVSHLEALRARRPVWVLASRERWRSGRFFDVALTQHVEATCTPVSAPAAGTFAVVFDCGGVTGAGDEPDVVQRLRVRQSLDPAISSPAALEGSPARTAGSARDRGPSRTRPQRRQGDDVSLLAIERLA